MKELLSALENHTTLAWVLKHAPDGNIDRALAAAWNECEDCYAMIDTLAWAYNFGPNPYGTALEDLLESCRPHSGPYDRAVVADTIRLTVEAPTWKQFFS